VDALGGAARAIEASFFQEEIARSAYDQQMRVEHGETVIVGVNKFADGAPPPIIPAPDYSALERDQVERLKAARRARRYSCTRRRCAARRGARGIIADRGHTAHAAHHRRARARAWAKSRIR
jgi:methylmalonyl-CoA mutase N-terminal domain/subunit